MIRLGVFFFTVLLASGAGLAAPGLQVPPGFTIERIASVAGARELAALPNGDLLVGTRGDAVEIVAHAEGRPDRAALFARFGDDDAAGIAYAAQRSEIFVGTEHHVFAIPYHGELRARTIRRIADVRTGPVVPGSDGDVHVTTSVAYSPPWLYVSVGSSCNATMDSGTAACSEVDSTRAAVSILDPRGGRLRQRARRVRNAIALTVDPQSGAVWIGDAGQDDLPFGHPYEFLDDLSAHPDDADYGWPRCEEDRRAYRPGANCARVVVSLVELPAYSTIIGATFYPAGQRGRFAFPARYRGGLFLTAHGSWHTDAAGCFAAPPRVAFVPMHGDRPVIPVDWQNPTRQWSDFVSGFQPACRGRIGRPTGIAVGAQGSLFVADDASGAIYRIRPAR